MTIQRFIGGGVMTLVLTVLIFLSCIAMLAIGVMFSRRPIKGGDCCKASDVADVDARKRKNRSHYSSRNTY
ncbi:hypothetical protein F3S07_07675 [Vibrio alginolyticus]|nr:hypothetical protein [Vibrio alginolyticus]NNN50794.1 hypothetical protein [Vibrio sp. 2-2(7)]NNN86793.1 hypothetical protein [Vibrio sp. 2-2(9)]EGR0146052.1 hypothetical protein [Vibrio alginolyticus]EGR0720138.1 hypothetical protein [Vibrio alginolyticus]